MTQQIKEIGIPMGMSIGTFDKTVYIDNKLMLSAISEYKNDINSYEAEGSWESDVIELADNFTDFDKVVLNSSPTVASQISILTRTSSDGVNWSEYSSITIDGFIQSIKQRFIQIKINLFAGYFNSDIVINSFDSSEAFEFDNQFIELNGKLKLKRSYVYEMSQDNSWNTNGKLFRKTIPNSNFKKINTIL